MSYLHAAIKYYKPILPWLAGFIGFAFLSVPAGLVSDSLSRASLWLSTGCVVIVLGISFYRAVLLVLKEFKQEPKR